MTEGSYKDPIVAKLSMKVSEYYKSATASANSAEYPSAAFFPVVCPASLQLSETSCTPISISDS